MSKEITEGKFTKEDIEMWTYGIERLLDILNGEYDLEEARKDLRGLIGSEFDTRNKQPHP